MITFLSATPGSGKSLYATNQLYELSRLNIKNLKYNLFLAKAFFEKIKELGLEDYLRSVTITRGQGLERTTELLFLEQDYFDFLFHEYNISVLISQYSDLEENYPDYYFERVSVLNEIIDSVNENENTKFQHFKPVRTIFTNIADLKLSQARPLPKDCDWRLTPQGSFFVIDEAQLIPIFSEEAKKIDPIVKDLTIHRHKGYDFLFITQEPSFVNKYIRKLASFHVHLVNIFGWEQSMKIEWTIVQENPNALSSLARAENVSKWIFPKHVYSMYKSSTIHTRKKRIPKKLVILIILAVIVFGAAIIIQSNNSSIFGKFVTGESVLDLNAENKSENDKQATSSNGSGIGLISESGKALTEGKKDNTKTTGNSDFSASNSSSNVSASEPVESRYDPSNPFEYVPDNGPSVVNHRQFSGCVKFQGKIIAVDQQGTRINGFNPKDCNRLIENSYDRPFDYFGNRQPPVQAMQQENPESDTKPNLTERVSTSEPENQNPETSSS